MPLVVDDDAFDEVLRRRAELVRGDGADAVVDLEQLDGEQQADVREVGIGDRRGMRRERERAERTARAEQHDPAAEQRPSIEPRHCIGGSTHRARDDTA